MMQHQTRSARTIGIATAAGLLFGVSLFGSAPLYAGPDAGWRPEPPGAGLDQRVERMTDQFDLTADQQTAVRKILETERAQLDQQRRETRKQIDAVLTEAQKAKRDEQIKKQTERRLARMKRDLDLTDEQTAKIQAIFDAQRTDPDLGPAQVRERISAVLTDEQRDAMQDRQKGRDRDEGPGRRERDDRPGKPEDADCDRS